MRSSRRPSIGFILLLLQLLNRGPAEGQTLGRCPDGSTADPFLEALRAVDIGEMRRLAPCASGIVDALPPHIGPSQVGFAVVKALVRDVGANAMAGQLVLIDEEHDFDMLRALKAVGVVFSSTALREATLVQHLPLARFLISADIGFRPSKNNKNSWQPLHSVFMSYTLVTVAKMLLNKESLF